MSEARKILVTSALPYANGSIHLGHMLEYIQTDMWVRFQKLFGLTREEREQILRPLVESESEATGSMGDDTPMAVLSLHLRSPYDQFRQAFAQVTNPPIDPIREQVVMSLVTQLGLPRYTPNTITDPKRLAGELARIRANRYSTDNEEFHAGLVCVAVPVVGKKRACAALAVHAPASRMPLERALSYLPVLRKAAGAMAASLDS